MQLISMKPPGCQSQKKMRGSMSLEKLLYSKKLVELGEMLTVKCCLPV